jgi:V8-like Glu-specific endopeptidase
MASLNVGTGLDAPISNRTEGAAEVAARVAQQDAEPGKGKAAAGLASGIEKVQGFSLPKVAASRSAKEVLSGTLDLPDIAEASFGAGARQVPKSVLETVHGPDDRVKITSTNVYPWRAHASLLITARDGSMWIGTGWFIGPHTLMTAGHVVYIKNSGVAGRDGFVRSIKVMPGRNGATLPYGSVTSSNLRTVQGWATNGDEEHDYGAIILGTDLGLTTGWFGFGVYNDATLTASVGNISGYPGDKPDGTQWYAARRIASVAARKVYYDIDTFGGQSGSAVYRIVDGKRYAFAVHAYGGATTNSGTRIVTPVYNNMVAWKA